ncbi:MAG: hypothetical protein IPH44_07705 [Myxococcales bacterium]|nr:hypothetical protein [Myxococcales bacterium]MBK7198431.1 hypothetical protein [Myxococcales bacterium]MBP6842111.1 hypothetical protein [Kofleriaceae bacterium]
MSRRALLLSLVIAAACGDDRPVPGADGPPGVDAAVSIRGARYCEVLPVFITGDQVEAQVWGTQGLSDCPAAAWAALDPSAIQQQLGAVMVVMNGPRHWVIDGAVAFTLPTAEHRMFGDLEMQLLATVRFPISQLGNAPYTTRTVARDTSFTFFAGAEIYELIAPDGAIYVMQSYAQIVDPALTEAALPGLGARLAPPAGWRYQVRTLAAPLEVRAAGTATVVQDELQNTYQRRVAAGG